MSESPVTPTMITVTEKGLSLKGSLLFSTVSSILSEGCSLLENHNSDSINIDMSSVDKIDSAGISLLLAWRRLCDTSSKKLQIIGAQEQAISLITTNKLEYLLNIS